MRRFRTTSGVAAMAVGALTAGLMAVPSAALATGAVAEEDAGNGHARVWDRGPGGERYVSMGDSFVSGPGIDPMRTDPAICARSERNFATLVATGLDVQAFTDASCGGAVLRDLTEPQMLRGGATNAAQLDALGPETTLVTLGTIGGNDVGLVGLASSCLLGDCAGGGPDDPFVAKVEATREPLQAAIRETKRRSPEATVVVVGYSSYLPPQGCPALSAVLTPDEAAYFQGMVDRLSDTMEETAVAEGVLFADLREIPGALEHTACAPQDEQWIRALGVEGDGVDFHPSSAGMEQMGWLVEGVIREERGLPAMPQPGTEPTDPEPTNPEQVKAELRAALKDVRLVARCRWADERKRPHRRVRVQIRGGDEELITRVHFWLGGRQLAVKKKAPYRVERRADKLRKIGERRNWRGMRKVRARVKVRSEGQTMVRFLEVRRPRCL